jgi:hypothetical protein
MQNIPFGAELSMIGRHDSRAASIATNGETSDSNARVTEGGMAGSSPAMVRLRQVRRRA